MRTISTKRMVDIKKNGGALQIDRTTVKEKQKTEDSVEKSLSILNQYVKQIVMKKDTTELILKSTSGIMLALGDIATKIDASARKKSVRVWDITVARDEDKLIKSLEMSAREE